MTWPSPYVDPRSCMCPQLAEVLREDSASKVWVLADEIYERIVYDVPHYSFVAIPGEAVAAKTPPASQRHVPHYSFVAIPQYILIRRYTR